MNEKASDCFEMAQWQYEKPPTLFDFVQNTIVSNLVRIVLHIVLRFYLVFYHRFRIINGGITQKLTSTIIAANHTSHLDVLALQSTFPLLRVNQVRSLAAKDYFFKNSLVRVISFFMANTIPMERKAYDSASFFFSKERLKKGDCLIIFPEGTRSVSGEIQNFKPGLGIMALDMNTQILPVYIKGTYKSFGKGKIFPKPERITVILGEPVRYDHLKNIKESWRLIANDIEIRIRTLEKKSAGEDV
jgi:1-acyl-sn-glycerol-3-phosphate acyltransferase